MGWSKTGFWSLSLVFVIVLMVTRGLAGRQGMERMLPASRGSPRYIDEDRVEQMWLNCGLNLMIIKEAVKSSEVSPANEAFHDRTNFKQRMGVAAKGSIHDAISLLATKANRSFLDCLNKQNFPFHNSGDGSLRTWLFDYLQSVLGWRPSSRRYLAEEPFPSTPASSPAPGPTSAPAPAIILASSPSPGVESPGYSPASVPAPAFSPDPSDFFLGPSPSSFFPADFDDISPDTTDLPSKKDDNSNSTIVIAVIVTAVGTSIFVALLFLCYLKCRGKKHYPGVAHRDDRPLLSLSLSDFSGSSQKSFGVGNSTKFGTLSIKTDPIQNTPVSSLDVSSVEVPPPQVLSAKTNALTESFKAPSNVPALPKPPPPPSPPVMAPPFQKPTPPPPGPPPPPPMLKPVLRPPPPPKASAIPPRPPQANLRANQSTSLNIKQSGSAISNQELSGEGNANAPKTKLKPFFWDKVNAKPDQSMVWDQIKAGSFQFNEEMIESLFGYNPDKNKSDKKKELSKDASPQYVRILDPKKSQNLAISLKAMNVKTEEVCEALIEGNELPAELLQTLLRMAPTNEEECKLRLYSGELSLLGTAEQFLKTILDIPFAFERLDVLLFMGSLQEEVSSTTEAFATLEVACKELRSSRLFLKLLEAVLKTGNRMNDGTFRGAAQAFKLDTLLKLSDVKGTDGKTTLLHFVVQEIIRTEGIRAVRLARESRSSISSLNSEDLLDDFPSDSGDHYRSLGLKVVSALSSELQNVKKAAGLDADALTTTVESLGRRLLKTKEFLNTKMGSSDEESQFHQSLRGFVEHTEADITSLLEEEKKIRSLVKSTSDYFHGDAGKDEGLRLFVIVRDFLSMVDKVCKEVRELPKPAPKTPKTRETPTMSPARDPRQLLFPAIKDRRMDSSSSDDDDP